MRAKGILKWKENGKIKSYHQIGEFLTVADNVDKKYQKLLSQGVEVLEATVEDF